MHTPLAQKLIERIQAGEKIGVDDFMHVALLDAEHGYYTNRTIFGKEGDFITAPEISQIFGEICAAYLAAHIGMIRQHFLNKKVTLVELGPGKGTLMRDMLRQFQAMPASLSPDDIQMIEASDSLIAIQKHVLADAAIPITWQTDIAALPKQPCVIIANEFLDALPIRQFMRNNDQWHERILTLNDGALSLQAQQTPTNTIEFPRRLTPLNGQIIEYPEAAIDIMTQLSQHIYTHGGMLLLIDYGYRQHAPGDTLQAVYQHHYVDVLSHIGKADITAHVNFEWMQKVAESEGLKPCLSTSQGQFLRMLGAELRAIKLCENASKSQQEEILSALERLMSPAQMGKLFKVLMVAHPAMPVLD